MASSRLDHYKNSNTQIIKANNRYQHNNSGKFEVENATQSSSVASIGYFIIIWIVGCISHDDS